MMAGRCTACATSHIVIPGGPQRHTGDVIDVNAGHPLAPVAQTPAKTRAEERQDHFHGPTVASEDEAGAEQNDACAGNLACLPFPRAADVGKEPIAWRRVFIDLAVAGVAIESDRRAADQNLRWPCRAGKAFDNRAGAENAAFHDAAAFVRGPKSEHRFAGEVKHGIKSVDIGGLAGDKTARGGIARIAAERHDIPALRGGKLRGASTDEAGGAGDAQAHGQNVRCSQR
jgi:hypothetical protein